ncbi:mitochondrial import inner membrane translocase subunit Tim29-like [Saccostrea echinata]|uniref:mitochondrial import inner membrane translocase subunit Tim29-like n=1 Tax=Saccostrea echinata TaxID=191078 RepID=UPI002A82FFD1|nr:mitochondrial import inner membrane translocase subunit Tim29-like [Saccostrea echinata]
MASVGKLLQRVKPTLPDKWKGGKIEKIGNYIYNIYNDYKVVAQETIQDCKNNPVKASIYISFLSFFGLLYKTNPTERDFKQELLDDAHEMLLIGEPIRNVNTDRYLCSLLEAQRDGRLRYRSLLFFSLVYFDNMSHESDLFEARCKLIKPHWKDFHKSIVEVGILGRFVNLRKAMEDYDVNPQEWNEQGMPVNPLKLSQLK